MATLSFFARTTSSNANATTLVIQSGPADQLIFNTDNPNTATVENGDLILESTGGLPDPDTWVTVNGVSYSFTYDVVGTSRTATGGGNSWPLALRGKQIAVITLSNGTTYFFVRDGSGTQALMDAIGNGNERLDNPNTDPPPTPLCFCSGTRLATPSGPRAVETLTAGDMVMTDNGEAKQVKWIGRTRYSLAALRHNSDLRPIVIPTDAVGPGLPVTDLHVSPQHRIVLQSAACELLFGTDTVLVAAKFLVGTLAEVAPVTGPVDYFHILLEDHDMLVSNGLPTKSFQPARRTIEVMDDATRSTLEGVLVALGAEDMLTRKDQFYSLKQPEAQVLLDRLCRQPPDVHRAKGGPNAFARAS